MATAIAMPKLGLTMQEGIVVEWAITLGGAVEKGRTVVLVESEKAQVELDATASPSVLLVAGYTFDGYDVYVSDTFVGTVVDPITGQPLQVIVPRNYENGWTLRVGGEWQATPQLAVRACVLRDHSGYQPDYYDPSLPDGHSWAASVGGGWAFSKAFSIDATFFHAWFDTVTATAQAPLPGTYHQRLDRQRRPDLAVVAGEVAECGRQASGVRLQALRLGALPDARGPRPAVTAPCPAR